MLWPGCSTTCGCTPAGSARDLFLHVDDPETVVARARPHASTARSASPLDLFPHAGPRLRERLGDVCVLPAPGRMVGAAGASRARSSSFKGHHGGLTPEEIETWVGIM